MQVTRRNFLVAAGAAAAAPFFWARLTSLATSRPSLEMASISTRPFMTGASCHAPSNTATRTASARIRKATFTSITRSTPPATVWTRWWSSISKGKFVRSWGRQFKGGAHGLTIRKEGSEEFLYLCDYQHGIVTKRTLKGEEVFTLGYPAESAAYKPKDQNTTVAYRPTNVAIAPNGDIYVGDGYGSSFINQYNQKAEYIRTFGGLGKGDDQVDCPHGLWIDMRAETPVLVVTDRGNSRLQRFTLEGKHIDSISGTSKMPCFLHERNGEVVIADLLSKVTILDRKNNVVATLGEGEYTNKDWSTVRNQAPGTFVPGQVRLPTWRLLRSRRQYFRRGVGGAG